MQILKEKGSSPLYLIAIIAFTLTLAISLISVLFTSGIGRVISMIGSIYPAIYYDSDFITGLYAISNGIKIGTVICSLPSILICIGLWLSFASFKKEGQPASTAGLTIVKGVTIFALVCYCIVIAFMLIFAFGLAVVVAGNAGDLSDIGYMLGLNGTYIASAAGSIVAIFFIVVILAAVLGILYYTKVIGSINRAKEIVITGYTEKNVSVYVAVFCIIGGACGIISSLISFSISGIISGLTSILFAIVLLAFRSAVNPYIQ